MGELTAPLAFDVQLFTSQAYFLAPITFDLIRQLSPISTVYCSHLPGAARQTTVHGRITEMSRLKVQESNPKPGEVIGRRAVDSELKVIATNKELTDRKMFLIQLLLEYSLIRNSLELLKGGRRDGSLSNRHHV